MASRTSALRSDDIRIEQSEVAPAFGQSGGGQQYRFLDRDGNPVSQGELREMGLIAGG